MHCFPGLWNLNASIIAQVRLGSRNLPFWHVDFLLELCTLYDAATW